MDQRSSSHPLKTSSRLAEISKISAVAIANVAKVDAVLKANIANINDLTIPSGVAPPLDTYTGAVAGYSTRLLRTAYTGACMRVRRASDSVEADVGFDTNNELSLTSPISNTSDAQSYTDFADFVDHTGTPTDARVRTWYDQAGSNDIGQSTAASQPSIYDDVGGLIVQNGKAAVTSRYASPASRWTLEAGPALSSSTWIFSVLTGDSTFPLAFQGDSGGEFILAGQNGATTSHYAGVTGLSLYKNGSSWSATTRDDVYQAVNGVQNSITLDGNFSGWAELNIGYPASSGPFMYVTQEVLIWNTDQSSNRTGIETNINNYFSIY